jgi:two-component system sensor histidine kinase KdpD
MALRGRALPASDRRVLGAFAAYAAAALEQQRLAAEAEAAKPIAEADRMRTALLTAVSHDLRSPLASAKAAVTSLRSPEVHWTAADREELLATADESLDRLTRLVGNLLDMSRLQTGIFTINTQPIGIEEVVATAIVSLHVPPERIEVDVPETLPRVRVDPTLLERAVANLIDNAMSFSPDDRPIRVEAATVGQQMHLRVIDTGPGIPTTERDRVFLPFQRLGDNPRNGAGVGLGLAVAKGFVHALEGELTVEDTPGGGCTMVMTLPLDTS